MKKLFLILTFVIMSFVVFAQTPEAGGGDCANAAPICTDYAYEFPLQTETDAEVGPDYDCLYSAYSRIIGIISTE
jgi:hypothetical protein